MLDKKVIHLTGSREKQAKEYFNCTTRERAVFEAGIKMGTIYHQFVGTPIASSNVESLERAIEEGVLVQPFVDDVRVKIDRDALREKKNQYDYQSLSGPMLDVRLSMRVEGVVVKASMKFIEELKYPLMFIESIEE